MPPLVCIVPSRNRANLEPCLRAVAFHAPTAWRLVVDDGLTPPLFERPGDEGLVEQVVKGAQPFVFARNVNIGIKVAFSDSDIVLLNDDALLQTPGGFAMLQRAAAENPEYGVIAACCNNVGNLNQRPNGHYRLVEEPRMVCFVCVLIPRRAIDLVGMLDEEFTGYGFEDDSYCLRVRRAGLKIGIHHGCYVDHNSLKSTYRGEAYPHDGYLQNAEIFRQKWGAPNSEL